MNKYAKHMLFFLGIILLIFFIYFFVGWTKPAEEIRWGVNFSQKQASDLGLDWKEAYTNILDGLNAKDVKIAVHWDLLEKEQGEYDFSDIDYQIDEAWKRDVNVVLAIGMKTPRWPECHMPDWAKNLTKEEQQQRIRALLSQIVFRYKDYDNLFAWQVENEPFLRFGECPWVDKDFVEEEVSIVKNIDKDHKVIITDTGEGSFWFNAAQIADIAGTTMYKKVWVSQLKFYFTYPYPPVFYHRKALLIEKLFNKEVWCMELQAEPWCKDLTQECDLEEQKETMDLEKFKYNIEFAKQTGFDTFYLWGAEWWYWMKEIQNDSSVWDEAKSLWN